MYFCAGQRKIGWQPERNFLVRRAEGGRGRPGSKGRGRSRRQHRKNMNHGIREGSGKRKQKGINSGEKFRATGPAPKVKAVLQISMDVKLVL